jgi:hypothetical protein
MNMAHDRRLELLDLEAWGPRELRYQRLDGTITTRPTPGAGEILELGRADRLDGGDLATSHPRAWARARAG